MSDDEEVWKKTMEFIKNTIECSRAQLSSTEFEELGIYPHLENCLQWLSKLEPNASVDVRIATYSHDIERALSDRIVNESYSNYLEYKKAHATKSANFVKEYLLRINANSEMIERVHYLIRHHDTPTECVAKTNELTLGLQLVKSSDVLSFFDVNIDSYMKKEKYDIEAILSKINFMFEKICGRSFEANQQNFPQKISAAIDIKIRERVIEIQKRAETLVLPMYLNIFNRLKKIAEPYDPRMETVYFSR